MDTSYKPEQRSVLLFGKAQGTCHSERASVEKFSSGSPMKARGDHRRGSRRLVSLRVLGMMWSLLKITAARDFPQRREWHPTPVFLPGESQGRGSLVGCCLWGHTGSDTTEAT